MCVNALLYLRILLLSDWGMLVHGRVLQRLDFIIYSLGDTNHPTYLSTLLRNESET